MAWRSSSSQAVATEAAARQAADAALQTNLNGETDRAESAEAALQPPPINYIYITSGQLPYTLYVPNAVYAGASLPAGFSLDPIAGVLTGTGPQPGWPNMLAVVLAVTNSGTVPYVIVISCNPPPSFNTPLALTSDFDIGGTTFTLTGANFLPGAAVYFISQTTGWWYSAWVSYMDSGDLQVTTPYCWGDDGPYGIQVVNPDGQGSGIAWDVFTMNQSPETMSRPRDITPVPASGHAGSVVTITGTDIGFRDQTEIGVSWVYIFDLYGNAQGYAPFTFEDGVLQITIPGSYGFYVGQVVSLQVCNNDGGSGYGLNSFTYLG